MERVIVSRWALAWVDSTPAGWSCRYELPWEDKSFEYPPNLAPPSQIMIDASNGASDYGNKFGEPLVCGYTRTFGQRLPNGERREWIKPIMFRCGAGVSEEQVPPG